MSLNDVLALKSCSTSSEFILKSPDLQWWTPAEKKKHFYPSVRCLKYPTALPRCAEDDLSTSSTAGSPVQGSGSEQFQEHVLRRGKYTSPKQKKRAGETFPGGMNTQWRNSCLLEALGACRENKPILSLSSCVMIAPSTAGNEKYNFGKAVISESLEFFPISLFSGNYKEAEFHDYRTWLMFYLLVFISCVCSVLSLWVLGFW